MPWILCGPGRPPDRTGLSSGSTAMTLKPGLRALMTSPTPVSVPPVPTPLIRISALPSVSRQISSAVVLRWISGLARFLNCWVMKASGVDGDQFLRLADGALHAFGGRGQLQFGAQQLQHLAALDRHAFRHGQDQPVALGGGHEGQCDAGIAGGRLDQGGLARLDLAFQFGGLDHGEADAVLDAGKRIEELQLADDVGLHSELGRQTAHADQRCGADGVQDAVVDLAAKFGHALGSSHLIPPFGTVKISKAQIKCNLCPPRGELNAEIDFAV